MTVKKALLDASSAILLYKAGLHNQLADIYDVILSESVFREITAKQYAGAAEYRKLSAGKQIRILSPPQASGVVESAGLDAGERDAIKLYITGMGDFIITDDGAAARFCKEQGIPFINALLFPVVLLFSERIDEQGCRVSMQKIIQNGRYSNEIITYARNCPRGAIEFALPR